ncbi:MAG: hypothetical protein ACOZBL_06060 [Patescibacteria group bacterium]
MFARSAHTNQLVRLANVSRSTSLSSFLSLQCILSISSLSSKVGLHT